VSSNVSAGRGARGRADAGRGHRRGEAAARRGAAHRRGRRVHPLHQDADAHPGKTEEVQVRLELNGPRRKGRPRTRWPPEEEVGQVLLLSLLLRGGSLFSRPALYTAVVGLAAVGRGGGARLELQGASSAGPSRMPMAWWASPGPSTRPPAAGVAGHGPLAGGGALAGGSLLWLVIVPSRAEPPSSSLGTVTDRAIRRCTSWLAGASEHEDLLFSLLLSAARGVRRGLLRAGPAGRDHLQLRHHRRLRRGGPGVYAPRGSARYCCRPAASEVSCNGKDDDCDDRWTRSP
jgi:hypothetical protein